MQINITPAVEADILDMAALLEELFSIETDFFVNTQKQIDGLTLFLADKEHCFALVAKVEGKVVGMLTAQILISTAEGGKVALLEDLVVNKKYRGVGVGKTLLGEMEQWSVKNKIKRLQLLADCRNYPALGFYKHVGWKETQLVCWRKYPL
jgi:ribosomal protein S18 acetylase RimI-like enzyme